MSADPSLVRYEDPEEFWSLPDAQIRLMIGSLACRGQEVLAPLLVYGIYRKHPIALSWAQRGGRKIGGQAVINILRDDVARSRLHQVLRYAVLGDLTADPCSGHPTNAPSGPDLDMPE